MTEEKKRPGDQPYSLEELNQQFSSITKKTGKKENSGVLMPLILVAVVLIAALIVWQVRAGTSSTQSTEGSSREVTTAANRISEPEPDMESQPLADPEPQSPAATEAETFHESILSEEEQEKWASHELNGENIYVELNSKIYLDGNNAYIRLINPIYSAYYYSITIYPAGEEEAILYQSEKIAPGTILEAVMLSKVPTQEQYPAVVKYLVYDENGSGLGTYSVNVEFTNDEQYK